MLQFGLRFFVVLYFHRFIEVICNEMYINVHYRLYSPYTAWCKNRQIPRKALLLLQYSLLSQVPTTSTFFSFFFLGGGVKGKTEGLVLSKNTVLPILLVRTFTKFQLHLVVKIQAMIYNAARIRKLSSKLQVDTCKTKMDRSAHVQSRTL